MSGDCALRRGDPVVNTCDGIVGSVIVSDGLTVRVVTGDGNRVNWVHADVIHIGGAP